MSSDLKLEAETGRALGSRSSRRLRRSDKIPAVVYGQGSEPLSVTLDRLKFRAALNAAGPNAVITLDVDGTDHLTIVKNMQRDPIANRVTHVDFMRIDLDQRLIVDVPITLVGEAAIVGREGAVVQQQMMTLTVEAPAGNIPQLFEADITEMSIDNPVRVSDLDMGSGVIPQAEDDALIAIGQRSRAAVAAEEAEEDELEEGEELDAEASDGDEEAGDDAGADS
ncbi:MAG: 50S ribosomal protein L25 [Actinomycetota bacterium]|jgi:large subunit ribosomal protein L25|nr:50S ribosomal protein L25 [Actinomycetota bacterium]|tara:strand:- start:12112 stop:12783 length:672 start_codon:yes stop_codon:yes gene_type:complete